MTSCFNPRPRTSGRHRRHVSHKPSRKFQSTPPYKRATAQSYHQTPLIFQFQSTPPYKRATDYCISDVRITKVSIHAPVQAGDFGNPYRTEDNLWFQSTPPYKRATDPAEYLCTDCYVSIHAPVQAGDDQDRLKPYCADPFQSTPPYKRATAMRWQFAEFVKRFNPRPRTSGRLGCHPDTLYNAVFQSTPPYKRAT